MSNFSKRAPLLLSAAILWFLSVPGLSAGEDEKILDQIVAKVNQDVITLTDLQNQLRLLRINLQDEFRDPQQLEKAFQENKKAVLKSMIQNRMMIQRAEELGFTSNIDSEVSATLENMRKQMGIPSMEVFEQALRERGMSLQEYRQNIKDSLIVRTLLQQVVYSKITLLTPEIEAYYNEHHDQFKESAAVTLAEILFLTEGKDKELVRKKAEEALNSLRAGSPFEDVAKQYSEGPTASQGGNIGVFKKGSLAEPIEARVFSMQSGEVSDIIETEYGLQIVKVIEQKLPTVKPVEEVRPQVQQALYQQKAQPELEDFLEELQQASYIYIAPTFREEYDVEGL